MRTARHTSTTRKAGPSNFTGVVLLCVCLLISNPREGNDVTGTYNYVNPAGALVTVNYEAGVDGFSQTRDVEQGAVQMRSKTLENAERSQNEEQNKILKIPVGTSLVPGPVLWPGWTSQPTSPPPPLPSPTTGDISHWICLAGTQLQKNKLFLQSCPRNELRAIVGSSR